MKSVVEDLGHLDEQTMNFLAEDFTISVLPNRNLDKIPLIGSAGVGPFRAQVPIEVPLWLALELKRAKLCRIQPPAWMEVPRLEEILKLERQKSEDEQENRFTSVPENYIELTDLLLKQYASQSSKHL